MIQSRETGHSSYRTALKFGKRLFSKAAETSVKFQTYITIQNSFLGFETSYRISNKPHPLIIIFPLVTHPPLKVTFLVWEHKVKTVCENLPSTYHFRHRHCTTRYLIKPKTVSGTLRFTHALPYIKIYIIYILIFTIFNSKWAKRRVTSRGHRDETSITFLFCFVLFCFSVWHNEHI